MRILAMTNLYPNPYQPHRATFVRHQVRILGERQPVRVIAPIAWTDEVRARIGKAVLLPPSRQVTIDGLTIDHPRYIFPPKVLRGWYGYCYEACVRKLFRKAVREFKPDLVFAPWAYPDGWAAVRLARAFRLPAVLQVHGSDILLLDQSPARAKRTREALMSADGIVAVSQDLGDRLVKMGVDASRVRVIYDGVDRNVFSPGDKIVERRLLPITFLEGERLILFVGNLLPVKAVDVLLKACSDPQLKGERIHVVIVGQGPLRNTLEQLANQLGVLNRVQFVGAIRQVELPHWYRAADLVVLPSHSEGVPNVLLEASACATPWVASRVGGIPEIAHLGRSRLIAPNDPGGLASAIREMLLAPPAGAAAIPKSREEAVSELMVFLEGVVNEPLNRNRTRLANSFK
jgi:glycosyltransferase involved in cell wall biosynthesis